MQQWIKTASANFSTENWNTGPFLLRLHYYVLHSTWCARTIFCCLLFSRIIMFDLKMNCVLSHSHQTYQCFVIDWFHLSCSETERFKIRIHISKHVKAMEKKTAKKGKKDTRSFNVQCSCSRFAGNRWRIHKNIVMRLCIVWLHSQMMILI